MSTTPKWLEWAKAFQAVERNEMDWIIAAVFDAAVGVYFD
jgi:hypothetical protein